MKELLDGAENAGGQGEEGGDEFEGAFDNDADQAEGQKEEPDDGVEDQRGKGERPADNEENEEEEKFDHSVFLMSGYAGVSRKVP